MFKHNEFDEYKHRLMIDRHNLDRDAEMQPQLFVEIAEQVSLAISRRDSIKLKLDQKEAELTKQFRAELSKREEKVTEKSIAAEVEMSPAIKKLREELIAASAEAAQWGVLREAAIDRRDMIKVEAQLYAANYFTRSFVAGTKDKVKEREADEVRTARERRPTRGR